MRKVEVIIAILLMFLPAIASAATYWVSPTGAAAWASCQGSTPLSGTSACSLSTANSNAVAGDVVFLRGGVYYKTLSPRNSGTAANRITFKAYGAEIPTFTVTTDFRWAILFDNKSYIVVDGIRSNNSLAFFFIGHGSSYNEFRNCVFENSGGYLYDTGYVVGYNTAFTDMKPSTNNWFHDCNFSRYGSISDCNDIGTICTSGGYNDTSGNNTFEDCIFNNGGHDAFSVLGRYNVLKNNEFHNEESSYFTDEWGTCPNSPSSGKFGNRCILLENGNTDRYPIPAGVDDMNNPALALPAAQRFTRNYPGTARDTLIEGNRIHHSGTPPDDDGANLIENAGIHTLIRFNDLYSAAANGVYFKAQPYPGASPAAGSTLLKSGSYGRVAFNTIYKTGIGDSDIGTGFKNGIMIVGISIASFQPWPIDVAIKNNINYDWHNSEFSYPSNSASQIVYESNYNLNPGFANPDTSSITSTAAPDFRLQSSSPCINAGAHLTQANGSGSGSTTLIVDDAWWFQDGSWGSALTHGVTLFPDWIAIGAVTNVVEIRSIDYYTKRITLASPMTWADNAPIWLYKNSDGKQVLYGNAPDIGAHEYDSGATITSCTNDCLTSGTRQCSGSSVQTCENYDTDSCLEWSAVTSCPIGQTCTGAGICTPSSAVNWNCGSLPGDINNDGKADIMDLSSLALILAMR